MLRSVAVGGTSRDLLLRTRGDTRRLGQALAAVLAPGDLVVLEGELGAGKTFLARSILRALGVPASMPVTSPTFEMVHEFAGLVPILHVDLYRLDASDRLRDLGLSDRIGQDAIALVEWGARFVRELGGDGLAIRLVFDASAGRHCRLEALGPRGDRLLAALRELPIGSAAVVNG